MRTRWMVLGTVMLPLVALAQEPADEGGDKNAQVLAALELPEQAQALRDDGVPEDQVAEALNASEEKGLDAGEASELLGEAHNAAKEHGKLDNFGTFVRSQLDAGLRGQELAAAIRSEHEKRAKGKGQGASQGQGAQKAKPEAPKGPPEDKGKPMEAGSGESVKVVPEGAPAGKGAPEGKGKPMEGAAPAPSPAPATGASGTRPGGKKAE